MYLGTYCRHKYFYISLQLFIKMYVTYYVKNINTTNAVTNRTTPKTRVCHDHHRVIIYY